MDTGSTAAVTKYCVQSVLPVLFHSCRVVMYSPRTSMWGHSKFNSVSELSPTFYTYSKE